jgi:hypothetical protein
LAILTGEKENSFPMELEATWAVKPVDGVEKKNTLTLLGIAL